jgi:hypothetical protein
MTVFYRSKELVINNEAIVELLSAQRFALSDLSRVHVTHRDDDKHSRAATPAMAGALVVAGGDRDLRTLPRRLGRHRAGHRGAALLRWAVPADPAPRLQLLAIYHGDTVCLFSTTDAQAFGQVRRGLLRALDPITR